MVSRDPLIIINHFLKLVNILSGVIIAFDFGRNVDNRADC